MARRESLYDLDPFGVLRRAVFDAARGRCEAARLDVGCRGAADALHHRLPRSRGGRLLDRALVDLLDAGEDVTGRTRHLAALCTPCHRWAHDSGHAYTVGLLVVGSAVRTLAGTTYYLGPDPELSELWPHP